MPELSLSGETFIELSEAILDRRAALRFKARGFSMSPFIRDGDVLTVSSPEKSAIRYGDVVFFIHPENRKAAAHRIVGVKKGLYLAKGDNTWSIDGFVSQTDILGRITGIERSNKRVYFGLGPEKFLIALLSRTKILIPLLLPARFIARLCLKKDVTL